MNRKQIEDYIGGTVYLVHWPFNLPVNTAEGKEFGLKEFRLNPHRQWTILKLTKGGKAIITDGSNTISVAPSDLNYSVTLK